MKKKLNIYLVIPAYSEEKLIYKVLEDLKKKNMSVVIVDDGSLDKTSEIVKKYPFYLLRHKINLGKGAALKTGCDFAFSHGADAVITMDSDGQHKIEDIPKFVSALENDYDIAFGSRNFNQGVPLIRYMGNKTASLLVSLLFNIYVSDLICGFRAFTKKAYDKIRWESSGYGVETEMVIRTAKSGLKHCEVPVEILYLNKVKGVTVLDTFGILFDVLRWKFFA